MGEELRVARGTKLDVGAAAQLNPDVDSLDRLELNANIISTPEFRHRGPNTGSAVADRR
jgi:hypothetical protein